MYRIGAGSDIMGPGTSLVQRINFNEPEETEMRGLGCARRAGLSGCGCDAPGLGVFDSMDPTSWGWQEWAIVGAGGYILVSMFFTTKRAARAAGEGVRRARKRVAKRVASRIAGD